jgi:hypothetical protein
VLSDFKDEQAVQFLTGGASKKWYWAQTEVGHLGVGPMLHGQIHFGTKIITLHFMVRNQMRKLALVCTKAK